MFAIGACVASDEKWQEFCLPGLEIAVEPDTLVMRTSHPSSIFEAYNALLNEACTLPELEGLILLHEDVEILDQGFLKDIRRAFATRAALGVIGVAGARSIKSVAWWEGEVLYGRVFENHRILRLGHRLASVEAVDGLLMALRPEVARSLRFDESTYDGWHGYDVDYCLQAREAGFDVQVHPLNVAHHTNGGIKDKAAYAETARRFHDKWLSSGRLAQARVDSPTV